MDAGFEPERGLPPTAEELASRLGELVIHLEEVQDVILQRGHSDGLEIAMPLYTAAVSHIKDAFSALHDADIPFALFYASAAFASIQGGERFFPLKTSVDAVFAFRDCTLALLKRDWEGARRLAGEFEEGFAEMRSADFRSFRDQSND